MLNPTEVWKDVVDFEGLYEVSSLGRIRNTKTGAIKAQCLQSNKRYIQVQLWKNNQHYGELVHRIVARAFIPNPLNKPQVNHLDKNDQNNRADNLEWVTCSENHKHAFANGRKGSKSRLGEKNSYISQYRYVYWDKRRKCWVASIKIEGKTHNIGRFQDEFAAAMAADDYILQLGFDRLKNFS